MPRWQSTQESGKYTSIPIPERPGGRYALLECLRQRDDVSDPGHGDYTKERQEIFADLTIDTLLETIDEQARRDTRR